MKMYIWNVIYVCKINNKKNIRKQPYWTNNEVRVLETFAWNNSSSHIPVTLKSYAIVKKT